jgi:hypothetical protein
MQTRVMISTITHQQPLSELPLGYASHPAHLPAIEALLIGHKPKIQLAS